MVFIRCLQIPGNTVILSGAIATIATILSMNGISIKNIGILHNREFDDGVLKIEFYDEEAKKHAAEQLTKRNYIIYER